MNNVTRRSFLKTSFTGAAALSLPAYCWAQVPGANDQVRVGVVGFNGRGKDHISGLRGLKRQGVRLVALCDADEKVLRNMAELCEKREEKVQTYTDVRKLLENKDIDAITTATPNHWHSLIAIWACQAGKDVYVEKPVSHNVWEGRQVVLAARKYQRMVQAGTQCRSNPGMQEMMTYLHEGKLGKIKISRGLCYKRRPSIGKTEGPQPIPPSVDYDLWTGPAPLVPLRRKRLHYDWHWVWPTGCGDLGNQGIHQMDLARWALNVNHLSPRVFSVGGRLGYEDDGETPNTQIVFHDYGDAKLIFEVRGLPAKTGENKMDNYRGAGVGVVVHCEGGYLVIHSYSDGTAFDNDDKEIRKFRGGGNHYANWLKAIRSRQYSDLNGDILEGHLSSALCHTGNVSYRLGKQLPPEDIRDAIRNDPEAQEACQRAYEHLQLNDVDLEKTPATLGLFLKMDPQTERFLENDQANALLTRDYRKPFVVPKDV